MTKLDKIKTHLKRNKDVYIAGGFAALVGVTATATVSRLAETKTPAAEPDRLADARHIVLENVNGENLWFDMDEPDNFYRLEGVS